MTRHTSLAVWDLSSTTHVLRCREKSKPQPALIVKDTTNMDDTIKFISFLLLMFPLFTEASHGGEYVHYTVVFYED